MIVLGRDSGPPRLVARWSMEKTICRPRNSYSDGDGGSDGERALAIATANLIFIMAIEKFKCNINGSSDSHGDGNSDSGGDANAGNGAGDVCQRMHATCQKELAAWNTSSICSPQLTYRRKYPHPCTH